MYMYMYIYIIYRPPQNLGVVAIEKGAFGSPSTKVVSFTYIKIRECRRQVLVILIIYQIKWIIVLF